MNRQINTTGASARRAGIDTAMALRVRRGVRAALEAVRLSGGDRAAVCGRKFGFPMERAVFVTVLHRILASGSDRAALGSWREEHVGDQKAAETLADNRGEGDIRLS